MKDDLILKQMENSLIFVLNWKTPSIVLKRKTTQNWKLTLTLIQSKSIKFKTMVVAPLRVT